MDTTTRFALGLLILIPVQLIVGSYVVHFVRRRNQVDPVWSWPRVLGVYCVFVLIVTAISLIPAVGRFAALIVSLVGMKRLMGTDILSTFIVSFCLGVLCFGRGVVAKLRTVRRPRRFRSSGSTRHPSGRT